jgi:hypothetical protein
VQHLDDSFATEERLIAAIYGTKAAGVESFTQNEFA